MILLTIAQEQRKDQHRAMSVLQHVKGTNTHAIAEDIHEA
jgi:hypothetical protein